MMILVMMMVITMVIGNIYLQFYSEIRYFASLIDTGYGTWIL